MRILRVTRDVYMIDLMFANEPGHISSYVIVGDGDEALLIETGPLSTIDVLREALSQLGVRLKGIIVTHIHLDHAGAAARLAFEANAPVYVHPRGAKHLANPARLCESAREVLGREAVEYVGCPEPLNEKLIIETSDGMRLRIGEHNLLIIHTPGHASHHQSIVLEGEGLLFTGDSLGMYICGCILPVTPPPFKPDLYKQSVEKMLSYKPRLACFTHYGIAPDPEALARELLGRLQAWGRFSSLQELFERDSCAYRVERVRENVPYFRGEVERSWLGIKKALESQG